MTTRSRRSAISPVLAAIMLFLSACGASRNTDDAIALRVETGSGENLETSEITSGEIEPLVAEIMASDRFVELAYGAASEAEIRADVATRVLYEHVMDGELADADIDPDGIDSEIARDIFQQQLAGALTATEADAETAAAEVGVEVSGYLDLLSRLVSKQTALGESIAAGAPEQAALEVPCASHILVEEQELADDLMSQLADGADFGELAMEFSLDPGSGANGGALGCTSPDAFVTEFRDAVISAPIGEVVGPVQTDFGFHIIVVTGIEEQAAAPVDPIQLAAPAFEQALTESVVIVGSGLQGIQWDPVGLRFTAATGTSG